MTNKSKSTELNIVDKKMILASIIQSNIIDATLYLNIVSFFPLYANFKFGDKISTGEIAVAVTAFEFAGILLTPIIIKIISKIGRKNCILISHMIMIISNTGLGLLSLIGKDKPKIFLLLSFILRFI